MDSLAFTWVPDPKKYTGKRPEYQFFDTLEPIRNLRLCCETFKIYPELTMAGNIHYHGLIVIKDKYKWHKKVLPTFKYSGFVCIKKYNSTGWDDYIVKDVDIMMKILNRSLPLDKEHELIRKRHTPMLQTSGSVLDYLLNQPKANASRIEGGCQESRAQPSEGSLPSFLPVAQHIPDTSNILP